MSMFERLGEKVERFKQEAVSARDDGVGYRCRNCDEGFYSERETCPECGSAEIDRIGTETEAETAAKNEADGGAKTTVEAEAKTEAEIETEVETEAEAESEEETEAETE